MNHFKKALIITTLISNNYLAFGIKDSTLNDNIDKREQKILEAIEQIKSSDDNVIVLLKKDIEKATEQENRQQQADALFKLGTYYLNKENHTKAIEYFNKSLPIYIEEKDSSNIAMIYTLFGSLYSNSDQIEYAEDAFIKARDLYLALGDTINAGPCINDIAILNVLKYDYKTAADSYYQLIKTYKSLGEKYQLATTYSSLGYLYSDLYLYNIDSSYSIINKTKNDSLLIKEMLLDSAFKYQSLSIPIFQYFKSDEDLGYTYLGLSIISSAKNENNQSVKYLTTAYAIGEQFNVTDLKLQSSDELSMVYEQMNLIDSAYYWLKNYSLIYQKTNNEDEIFDKGKSIAELENSYKQELLKKEQELQLNKSKAKLLQISIAFISILIIFIIISIFFYFRNKLNNQSEFLKGKLQGEETERKRLAMELHDSVGQSLTLIKHQAYNLQDNNLLNSIEKTNNSLRILSKKIYPTSLSTLGLKSALLELIKDTEKVSDLNITCEVNDYINSIFNQEEQLHIFRIIQECLNNTLKHSNASAVRITESKKDNSTIEINYIDNGKGITTKKNKGLGHFTIDNRVKFLNGHWKTLNIDNGFLIKFTLNL